MRLAYRAKERSGAVTTGELEAASLAEARNRLRSQGLFVLSVTPLKAGVLSTSAPSFSLKGRIRKTDLVMMLSQLTIMCQSGVDLAEALESVAGQCPKPALQKVMGQVSNDVAGGCSFSDALRRHPHAFDGAFVAGVAAGEHSGSLTTVLERLTQLMRGDVRLHNAVWAMVTYPLVLCGVTILVLNAMVFFVLPQFSKVFASLDRPPPPLTQCLLSLGDFVRDHMLLVCGTAVALCVAACLLRKTEMMRRLWDHATLNLAVVRNATRALCTGRAFRLLGTMLMSGVPLVEGVRLCRAATGNGLFRELFERVERDILHGEGLSRTFLASPFLPPGAAQMVATAERTGKLGDVLKTVGEYFEDEGERHLREVIKVLEPAVIVFLGMVVAGVVLSVILPLLDVSTMSH